MEIAVLGGFGVGKTMYLERYPEQGETVTGGVYHEGPGGKASNQAIQIRRLGVAANLITAVGTDSGAALGRDLWLREGVNTDGVVVLDAPTMVGFICVDSNGDNRIAIAPGALAHMTLADVRVNRGSRPCVIRLRRLRFRTMFCLASIIWCPIFPKPLK